MSKKANYFQTARIITQSIWYTFYYSMVVIIKSSFRRCTRQDVDRLEHAWARKILEVVKLSYRVHNPHQVTLLPNKAYVIMSNHCSHYDIPLIIDAFPGSIRLIAKKELFKIPVWGRALLQAEFIFIDRTNRRQAWHDLANAKQKIESGIAIWISPEGTRSKTGQLQPFKKGGFVLAMQTDATIIPVTIRGSSEVLPAKTTAFHLGVEADVYLGQPIAATEFAKNDYAGLMQAVENQIKSSLEPLTDIQAPYQQI